MDPAFAFFIMMNNYIHDLAIAMLLASGIIMKIILSRMESYNSPEARVYMLRFYAGVTKVVLGSLVLITAGAIPRILTFTSFELADASGKNRISGLIAKNLFAFGVVMFGVLLWINLSRRIRKIRDSA